MTAAQLGELHRQHTEYIHRQPSATPAGDPAADPARDPADSPLRDYLLQRYRFIRAATERLTAPLQTEDYVIQTMPDVSPAKWHLGHTSWFFETFLLKPHLSGYRVFHERFDYLFNSYYVSVGDRHCRIKRGTLSRPTVADVYAYRQHVDEHMTTLLETASDQTLAELRYVFEIGFHHEQQHQELAATDLKHVFACNPLYPEYREDAAGSTAPESDLNFVRFDGGLFEVGHSGGAFAYDNEQPRHKTYLQPFELADRLVTNGDWLEFMNAGGYEQTMLWLSSGWAETRTDPTSWSQPFYWHQDDAGQWHEFTLGGLKPVDPAKPVTHLSYYEADAYARWRGCRLPTEFEWEVACEQSGAHPTDGNFVEDGELHPRAADPDATGLRQMYGDLWEWTQSQYTAYPGYRAPDGALGEYNGKFMCNQFVLRGGSCVTPRSHIRSTYRNFFPPESRWQMTGLRLARDVADEG